MKLFSIKSTLRAIAITITAVILTGFVVFWYWLDEYQTTLPSQYGDQIVTAFEEANGALLRKLYPTFPDELSKNKDFEKYLVDNKLQENLSFYQSTAEEKDAIVYEFKGGDKKLAHLILKPSGEDSFFGFTQYIPIWFELIPLAPCKITVPDGANLFINGKPISEKYYTSRVKQGAIFDELGGSPIYVNEYQIPEYITISSAKATTSKGSICELDWDKSNSTIDVLIVPDDKTKRRIKNFSLDAAKKYIVFATKIDAPRNELMPLLAPDTLFAESILKYDNSWGVEYVTDSFSQIVVDEYISYSNSAFSCRVKLKYNVLTELGVARSYDFNSTMYLTMKNGRLYWVGMDSLV